VKVQFFKGGSPPLEGHGERALGCCPNPNPFGKGRVAHPGARGAGARAGNLGPDPAPRKHRGGRGVEAVPLRATTRADTAAQVAVWAGSYPAYYYVGRGPPTRLGRVGRGRMSGRHR